MKKVLITGATGFVGKHLLEELELENYQLALMTRIPEKLIQLSSKFEIRKGDLNDLDSLKEAFQGIDVLINLAAEVRNVELLEKTNVQGTQNLIDAISVSGIQKVIHLSSVGVVGKGFSPLSHSVLETENPRPQNEYERTKLLSEQMLIKASETGFSLTVLRPTNVFGENHPFKALLHLMSKVQEGTFCPYIQGAQVNYVYVKDLCAAIIHFLPKTDGTQIYQVGDSMSLKEFYLLLGKKLGVKSKLLGLPSFVSSILKLPGVSRLQAIGNKTRYDDGKLKKEIGAYPFGVSKGIEQTIAHYRQNNLLP